jgi:hypothetical protein
MNTFGFAKIKSQQIQPLPHFGHEALFYQNNAVPTRLMNNNKFKIDLFSILFLYYDNEDTRQNRFDIQKYSIYRGLFY